MTLRVKGSDRPGFAILEFDGVIDAQELLFSLQSMISRNGLYLTNDGNWEKTPRFFKAVRLTSDSGTTSFGVGPDIVNHVADQDTIKIVASDNSVSAETVWENGTPELQGSPRTGWVHVPKTAPRRADDASRAVPASSFAPSGGQTGPNPEKQSDGPDATEGATTFDGATGGATPPPRPNPSVAWLTLGFVVCVLLSAVVLWRLPEQRCRWFGGALGGCGDIEATITCIAQKTSSAPCEMEQSCAVNPDAPSWSGVQSERLRQALSRASVACVDRERKLAGQADTCIANAEQNDNSCNAASCAAAYLSTFPNGASTAALRQRVDNAAARCNLEHDAAQSALACADAHERDGLVCDFRRQCVDTYASDFPRGSILAQLRQRASAADQKCAAEPTAAHRASACLDAKRASRDYCAAGNCLKDYELNFAGGRSAPGLKAQAVALDGLCEVARLEKEASDCASAKVNTPCLIENLCIAPNRERLGHASPALDRLSKDAVEACRQSLSTPEPPPAPSPPMPIPAPIPTPPNTPAVPSGAYSGSVASDCGGPRQSVSAQVTGNRVSWSHRDSTWSGTIDADQNISATAHGAGRTYSADGAFPNRVVMHYPDCNFVINFRMVD
jgi:hypothetical protein